MTTPGPEWGPADTAAARDYHYSSPSVPMVQVRTEKPPTSHTPDAEEGLMDNMS